MSQKLQRPVLKTRQSGQALTEFLVISVALLPLFLLIPIIAKYQGIAHATQMASRYVAFDSMVRYDQGKAKSTDELQAEIRRRFFGNSDAPIKTKDVAGDFKANQNLFWRGPTDLPIIEKFSDITLTQSSRGSIDGTFFKAALAGTNAGVFGTTDIQSSAVTVKLANLPTGLKFYKPFDKINLSMSRSTSVLNDAWTGKDPEDVKQKFGKPILFPAGAPLRALQPFIDPLIAVSELFAVQPPKLGSLDYWTDQVPCRRLDPPC